MTGVQTNRIFQKKEGKKMKSITIDGKLYEVKENLGFQPGVGHYAKVVDTPDGERVAVKRGAVWWTFWTTADKLRPAGLCVGMSIQEERP